MGQQRIDPVAQPLRQHGVLGQQHPAHPLQGGGLFARLGQPLPQQQQMHLAAQLAPSGDQTGHVVGQLALMMFGNDQYAHDCPLLSSVDVPACVPITPPSLPPAGGVLLIAGSIRVPSLRA